MNNKIGLGQIEALKKEEFKNLKGEIQEFHEGISGLSAESSKVKNWISKNAPYKTLMFYFNRIRQENQKISMFCPLKGKATKMYVNMGTPSTTVTYVDFKDSNDFLIGNIAVQPGNVLEEATLNHDIDHESLKVIIRGEMQLQDVCVSVEIVPEGSALEN